MSFADNRPLNRAERRKRATHERIRAAAWQLLAEVGYAKLTVRMIADAADIGYGTFYLHFADKDTLIWELLVASTEIYQQKLLVALQEIAFPYREFLGWVAYFEHCALTRENFLAMFGSNGSPRLYQLFHDYTASIYQRNIEAQHYSSGMAKDAVPPSFYAEFISGAVMRLSLWWLETPTEYSAFDMAAMLFHVVYRQPIPQEWRTRPLPPLPNAYSLE